MSLIITDLRSYCSLIFSYNLNPLTKEEDRYAFVFQSQMFWLMLEFATLMIVIVLKSTILEQ